MRCPLARVNMFRSLLTNCPRYAYRCHVNITPQWPLPILRVHVHVDARCSASLMVLNGAGSGQIVAGREDPAGLDARLHSFDRYHWHSI